MDDVFEEAYSPEVGLFLVSKKSFNAGDKVYSEDPVLLSPYCEAIAGKSDDVTCFGCCKVVKKKTALKCTMCKWFACSENCITESWHTEYECNIFQKKPVEPSYVGLDALFTLRLLMVKEKFPQKWKNIMSLSDDLEVQTDENKKECEAIATRLFTFLSLECGMNVGKLTILKLMRITSINSFSMRSDDKDGNTYHGKGLFTQCSMMMNECDPSLDWIFLSTNDDLGERWQLTLFARKDIKVGDILSIAYIKNSLKYDTMKRRLKISESLHFYCKCMRCRDSSELGTNFSGIICGCGGIMQSEEPLSFDSGWKCVECHSVSTNGIVRQTLNKFNCSFKAISTNTNLNVRCQQLDDLIKDCENKYKVHKNHSLVIRATVEWLQRVNLDKLLAKSPLVDNLYDTLLTRAKNCIQVLSAVGAAEGLGICQDIIARAIIKYCFKSKTGRSIEDNHYLPKDKIEILERIVMHLEKGIQAFRLSNYHHQSRVEGMNECHAYYKEKLRHCNLVAGVCEAFSVSVREPEKTGVKL